MAVHEPNREDLLLDYANPPHSKVHTTSKISGIHIRGILLILVFPELFGICIAGVATAGTAIEMHANRIQNVVVGSLLIMGWLFIHKQFNGQQNSEILNFTLPNLPGLDMPYAYSPCDSGLPYCKCAWQVLQRLAN